MKEKDKIYVVTTMHIGFKYGDKEPHADGKYYSYEVRTSPDQKKYFTIINDRTWGWYNKFEDAEKCVVENWADIYEGEFNYAVIEEKKEGILMFDNNDSEHWYKWEGTWEEGKYVPCNKPEEFSNIVGFSF